MAMIPNLDVMSISHGVSDGEARNDHTVLQGIGAQLSVAAPSNSVVPTVKSLAYGGGSVQPNVTKMDSGAVSSTTTYRVERGFPYYRRGRLITVNPQFRSLNIIAQNKGSVASTSFTTTNTNVTVAYPKKVV